ncbi:MAG: hypothetical protein ACOCYG_06445, partial [Spirochaetota bacterium]
MVRLGRVSASAAALMGAALLLAGCMSAENLDRHLARITVEDPDFSLLADGTYEGDYDIDLP